MTFPARLTLRLFIFTGMLVETSLSQAGMLEAQPLIPGDTLESTYKLEVNGTPVPVARWGEAFCLAHFSIAPGETAAVRIKARTPVTLARLSPHRDKIPVTVTDDTAAFSFSGRRYLAFRADSLKTLFLFADPAETNPPRPGDAGVADIRDFGVRPDGAVVATREINDAIRRVSEDPAKSVLYFPPGLYRAGTISLQSGVTLYLAAGALLKASDDPADFDRDHPGGPYGRLNFITAFRVKDCGIRGRGVIDGNALVLRPKLALLPARTVTGRPGKVDANRIVNVQFSHVENGFIEGVFSRNSASWNTVPHFCTDLRVENYKVVSSMVTKNDDGIDPDSCVRLVIRDSFFLARDDGIVLKTTGTFKGRAVSPDGTSRDMDDVLISNNVVWSETAALKYGFNESEAGEVRHVRFENNVVLNAREGVQIRTGGPAVFRDAIFSGNWYESIRPAPSDRNPSYNYRLDDASARDLRFINETHDEFAPGGSDIKASRLLFENLSIAGEVRTTPASARFHVKGNDVKMTAAGGGGH